MTTTSVSQVGARCLERRTRPRMEGEDDGPVRAGDRSEESDPRSDRLRRSILGAMDRREQVSTRREVHTRAGRPERGRVTDERRDPGRQVLHEVADELDPVDDAFCREVVDRRLGRDEQPVRQVVGDDPVDLLGHPPVE